MSALRGTPLAAAIVAATLAVTQVAASERRDTGELDVSALAITASHSPTVSDEAFDVGRLRGRDVAAETSATATSDCDGCTATGVAVTVSYVSPKDTVRADNIASAWSSSCAGCTSRAVSVQVVVLHRAATLRVDNRALAAAAGCRECTTSALAYQLVVVSDDRRTFDRQALDELRRWARAQAQAQAPATAGAVERRAVPGATADDGLAELEEQAEAALGPVTTLHRDVDVVEPG